MTVELGHFALILALLVAIVQAIVPLFGAQQGNGVWMALAKPAAVTQCVLITGAFAMLMRAYIVSDFSVHTVALHSHTDNPLLYRITGLWGNHEGSMMLWVMILSMFGTALAVAGNNLPLSLRARALSIQAMITAGFLLFILFIANPFWRLDPPVVEGRGFNPLLQDPGLAFHPPLLYLGYVGFSIAFSFAIAALIEGWVDPAWARWVRPWTLAAWVFLTLGIALGSWWAYYELGWGGWWFWDPVENAALIPWLAGTALLHSILVVEKRDALKKWTILLAIITFSLSLLGTFLVRSGILTSVHTFAADPTRGVFILSLLAITVGSSLLLFTLRAPLLQGGGLFSIFSREGSLLVNNTLLSVVMATVLLGTLYPLFADIFGIGQLSVGAPFFNQTVAPLWLLLLIVMSIGPLLAWKQGSVGNVLLHQLWPAVILAVITASVIAAKGTSIATAGGMGIAMWLGIATLVELVERLRLFRVSFPESLRRAKHLPRSAYGMTLSHFGLAVLVAGIIGATAWETEKILILQPTESTELAGYTFTMENLESVTGPNYRAIRGTIIVRRHNNTPVATLHPERRHYTDPPQLTTEAAIHSTGMADIYVTMGEYEDPGVVIRLYHKPLVPWLWYGTALIALGGLVSLSDRRRHRAIGIVAGGPERRASCL
ncbi:Cytochrome c heme lyase subunit CcmF [invertebrate metagenome]|uniref:Cytochrome c heme lyase subunit CcmF n=1 Tax=invertebrate metagenome TaxID=1711999 RepID=A0A484H4J2_9ZZZZ